MPIDPYSPCPGGTGKKIKFCCPDLTAELDKVQRMLEGDQRAGCLDYLQGVLAKYPDRACLLSIKAMLEAQLGQQEKAEATLATYMEKYPDNPVALAEQAALKASEEEPRSAVDLLQGAIEACGDQMPSQVYDSIGVVAEALVGGGYIPAARAHLTLQLAVGGMQDARPMTLLGRLNGATGIPLLLRQDMPLVPAPDDALWKMTFSAALDLARRGVWKRGAEKFLELATKAGDWPPIWHNISTLRAWLGDHPGAVEALRKLAAQPVPLDDAVEAEALAQLLDENSQDEVDVLTIEYAIRDFDALQAQLLANGQVMRMPVDLTHLGTEEEPPPKGAFWLLDRPSPTSAADLSLTNVPHVVGQVFLFGKQTDREARLELVTYRTSEREQAEKVLQAAAGDALGERKKEEVTGHAPAVQHALGTNWRLPEGATPQQRLALINEHRRNVLLHDWPQMPQRVLGGKTPREAAADPVLRIKALAEILNLELSPDLGGTFDFNELRRELGLPQSEPVDPAQFPQARVPLARLGRLNTVKLTDEDLIDAFHQAEHFRHMGALATLAKEIVRRESLNGKVEKASAYGALAQTEPDSPTALGYLEKAREAAKTAKTSCGPWDLAELMLRISRAEVAEADRLLQHIRDQHLREPGMAQALYQVLAEAGIINPDGTPVAPAAQAAPGIVVPGAAATAEAGKIWTPGSEPATGGGKKSTIWTPD